MNINKIKINNIYNLFFVFYNIKIIYIDIYNKFDILYIN
jgi:hypothetical protein